MSLGLPVKVGNRYYSWYSYGHLLYQSNQPLPRHAHPHLVQGYNKAAVEYAAYMLSCELEAWRKGLYKFLPAWLHLEPS